MAISDKDIKLLWGRAAGRCSYCKVDLTIELDSYDPIVIGEMAHVIARKENGPRGSEQIYEDERNSYKNLILLCPNHHKMIDKAPDQFSVDEILDWKRKHEESIRNSIEGKIYKNSEELFSFARRIMMENHMIWSQYGPNSLVARRNPISNAKHVWDIKKISSIIPNNKLIINTIEKNIELLSENEFAIYLKFKTHVDSFEINSYERQENEAVITFPEEFAFMIRGKDS